MQLGERNMWRILHLIPQLDPGGAENHLLALVRAFPRDRYQIDVAYLKTGRGSLTSAFEATGCRVFCLGTHSWFAPNALRRLCALLRKGRYDLLHTHLPRADIYGAVAARIAEVRRVISTKHSESFSVTSFDGKLIGRLTERGISHSIAISDHLRRFYLRERIVPSSERISTVHYGLNVQGFLGETNPCEANRRVRAELGIGKDALVVGTLTRLVPEKPNSYLLRAFALLKPQVREAHLLIVGDGRQREELEALASQLGIGRSVTFAGFRRDVPNVMASLDIYVQNSIREAFGLVLLEAMAFAKPVVATKVGAIPEIVEHAVTGILVPERNSQALAAAILTLSGFPDGRRTMGEAGFARLIRHFSVWKMTELTVRLYEDCLKAARYAQ